MENSVKQQEETPKKQWVEPEMQEILINSGGPTTGGDGTLTNIVS